MKTVGDDKWTFKINPQFVRSLFIRFDFCRFGIWSFSRSQPFSWNTTTSNMNQTNLILIQLLLLPILKHNTITALNTFESNNTHFLISLFENFLKDILKSALYLFGTLINKRVVKYLRWLRMSLTFRSSYPLQRNNNTLQQWSKHRFILCHTTWNWLNRLNALTKRS